MDNRSVYEFTIQDLISTEDIFSPIEDPRIREQVKSSLPGICVVVLGSFLINRPDVTESLFEDLYRATGVRLTSSNKDQYDFIVNLGMKLMSRVAPVTPYLLTGSPDLGLEVESFTDHLRLSWLTAK